MKKNSNVFKYEKEGEEFIVETERYGVCAFDIFVTIESMGAKKEPSYIPLGHHGVIMLRDFKFQGKRVGIRPPSHIMSLILEAENAPTEESEKYKERKRKEKEWDNLYNDGGDGYNPYRTPSKPDFHEPHYKGDENPE